MLKPQRLIRWGVFVDAEGKVNDGGSWKDAWNNSVILFDNGLLGVSGGWTLGQNTAYITNNKIYVKGIGGSSYSGSSWIRTVNEFDLSQYSKVYAVVSQYNGGALYIGDNTAAQGTSGTNVLSSSWIMDTGTYVADISGITRITRIVIGAGNTGDGYFSKVWLEK